MTCIIGYRDEDGEILLSADNRISKPSPLVPGLELHIDQLQKIYFPEAFLAFAFATDDLLEVRRTLKAVKWMAKFLRRRATSHLASVLKCQGAIYRMLHSRHVATLAPSEYMVAAVFPGMRDLNRLYYCRFSGGNLQHFGEVRPGQHRVAGSVAKECDASLFESAVVARALRVSGLDMLQRVALFNSLYLDFQDQLPAEWRTIGQSFYSLYTRDGVLHPVSNDTFRVTSTDGLEADYSIDLDLLSGQFRQINHMTGEAFPLIPIDGYDFSRPDAQHSVFRVLRVRR